MKTSITARILLIAVLVLSATVSLRSTAEAQPQLCDAPAGVTCDEYWGEGKKGSFFRIAIPSSPAWNGDLMIVNHGFELDSASIKPHHTCRVAGTPCTVDADCPLIDDICNEITFFGMEETLLAQGVAVAASTYSQTGWSVFQSRKDLKDILKYMKKEAGVGSPGRVFITGFSMGGGVTIDASLRMNPKGIAGIAPLCPAAAGGLASWDAAMDTRMAYDFVCNGISGGQFFSPVDQASKQTVAPQFPSQAVLAARFDTCMGVILGPPDAAQQVRLDQYRGLLQHTGSDFEMLVLVGFSTQGVYDLNQKFKRTKGKTLAYNPAASAVYADTAFNAGVQRFETPGKGRKKLNKNYFPDFTKGKGSKINYPIVTLANDDDFLTIPGMQHIYRTALTNAGLPFTQAFISGGSHCNFSSFEVNATLQSMIDWADTGVQPGETDIEATCLALPGATPTDCEFNIGFVPPPLTDRIPARPDWPLAAK